MTLLFKKCDGDVFVIFHSPPNRTICIIVRSYFLRFRIQKVWISISISPVVLYCRNIKWGGHWKAVVLRRVVPLRRDSSDITWLTNMIENSSPCWPAGIVRLQVRSLWDSSTPPSPELTSNSLHIDTSDSIFKSRWEKSLSVWWWCDTISLMFCLRDIRADG